MDKRLNAEPTLLPYQREGVRFLTRPVPELNGKRHYLLGDEQGLGKTCQAIMAMYELGAKNGLIICPAGIKVNWARQMVVWGLCKSEDIYIVQTRKDNIPDEARFLVCNYELAIERRIYEQLRARTFACLVLDEAHRLKTLDSQRSRRVLDKTGIVHQCVVKILLTGTPVPNRPIELYPVLKTLAPELIAPYKSWVDFGRYFCNGYAENNEWNFKGASNVEELRERIQPFMLRREIKDVYEQLPAVMSEVVYLDVDYTSHPEVIEECENPEDPDAYMPGATVRRITAELKQAPAAEYIYDLLQSVDKVLVFAYHRGVIEFLQTALAEFNPTVIYGGVGSIAKQQAVDSFIADPTKRVVIGQMMSCGEGIDGLQEVCSNVVYVELDWSAGVMAQSLSRLRRIGQTETVFARYLIATGTIEMIMAAVLERKQSVINTLIATRKGTSMTIEAKLDRIIELLEAGAGSVQLASEEVSTKPAAAEKTASKPSAKPGAKPGAKAGSKPAKKSIAYEDVRSAAAAFVSGNKDIADIKDQARAIIQSFGAKDLNDLENFPDEWEAVIQTFAAGPVEAEASDEFDGI